MTTPIPVRPAWYRNPLVWIVLVLVVPLAIAVALAPWLRPRLTAAVLDDCRRHYAEARSAADTAAADAYAPLRARSRNEPSVVCGDLRRRGRLR
jgi:hypothetical protein